MPPRRLHQLGSTYKTRCTLHKASHMLQVIFDLVVNLMFFLCLSLNYLFENSFQEDLDIELLGAGCE